MYELRHLRWWLAGGAVLVLLAILASLAPGSQMLVTHGADKLGHAVLYGSIFLWFAGILRPRAWWLLLLMLLGLGGVMEILQAQIPGRSQDFWDLVANGIGLAAGLIIARFSAGGWCERVERLWNEGPINS